MSKMDRQKLAGGLANIRNRVDRLGHKVDHRRFDVFDDQELQLLIALYRKAKGCVSLARFAILELTGGELIAAKHAGHGFELLPFSEERLSQVERDRLDELQSRIV